MRKSLRLVALVIPMVLVASNSYAAAKAGSTCPKLKMISISAGKIYTCIKSGKKLVWDKGALITTAQLPSSPGESNSPSPNPTNSNMENQSSTKASPAPAPKPSPSAVTITMSNLIENSANVSYTAWKRTSDAMALSSPKTGSFSVYTGPNTPVLFNDFSYAISQVSKIFPNMGEPKETLWIRYNSKDIKWAENIAKEKMSPADYNQISQNQGGTIANSNCENQLTNCRGSYQQTGNSGISLIMLGVENAASSENYRDIQMMNGMLQAHEYFHSLQRIPIMNTGVRIWPHAWWREGSADWIKNVAINFRDYAAYESFLKDQCANSCSKLAQVEIEDFLKTSNENYVSPKFDQFLNYSLGSQVIEKLVAIRGVDALIQMYVEMGKGRSFEEVFNEFYGISWQDAIPVLSKSIYLNLHG